jgi:regulator of cell morphogenesis and NO signaling
MKTVANNIIGEIVANDYRTAAVFQKYGIDFCCQGNRTVEDACEKKSIDTEKVLMDLEAIQEQSNDNAPDYNTWTLDRLADHIQAKRITILHPSMPATRTG